jgi:hypothetical protein
MTKLTSLALGAGLALASIGFAHAEGTVTGPWTLTVGVNDAPCTLTLTADQDGNAGPIGTGDNCPSGLNTVTSWKSIGNTIQLYSGSGELVAMLKAKGDTYVGTRILDGRKLALSR